jgi:hypothetical protein
MAQGQGRAADGFEILFGTDGQRVEIPIKPRNLKPKSGLSGRTDRMNLPFIATRSHILANKSQFW